ncbi:MAG: heme ABC transporter ATP-binding protein [Halioglobus sp.]
MKAIQMNNVNAAPWGPALLENISLELDAGEALGIIGPNGAGKTSLLQLLTGDIAACGGELIVLGRELAEWKTHERAQTMAVLPQLSLLNFPYSVEEVILLGRTPHSSGRKEDQAILQEVMQATDTHRLADRIYTQLSGGEKQRVQLARVFAQIWRSADDSPRLLLLDEPTAALDLAHQQLVMETLRALAASGCAIVMVAHDFNLIAAVSDQITALSAGRQIAQGPPETVLTPEVFREVFSIDVTIMAHPKTHRPLVISL